MFLLFSGNAGEEIVTPYSASHALTGDLEIEAVFRIMKANTNGTIVCFAGYDNAGVETIAGNALYTISINTGRIGISHEYGNGTNFSFNGPSALPVGTWIRLRLVRNGLSYSVYLNGVLHATATFASNQVPTFGSTISPNTQLRVGNGYLEQTTASRLTDVILGHVKIKNASGSIVYELGEDPGGTPGTNPPFTSARFVDSFQTAIIRPTQFKGGAIPLDSFGGNFERKPQRGTGYILDMTGAGGGNTEPAEINPPRAYPLEGTWKKANPTSFNN